MGMFDYLSIPSHLISDSRLNDPQRRRVLQLQTKDLDNYMHDYFVTNSGLLKKRVTFYKKSNEVRNSKDFFTKYTPPEIDHIDEEFIKNTCTITACDFVTGETVTDNDIWFEIELVFIDGVLTSNRVITYDITSSKERVETEQKWALSMKLYKERMEHWYFRWPERIKRIVRDSIYKLGRGFGYIGSLLQTLSYKIR